MWQVKSPNTGFLVLEDSVPGSIFSIAPDSPEGKAGQISLPFYRSGNLKLENEVVSLIQWCQAQSHRLASAKRPGSPMAYRSWVI